MKTLWVVGAGKEAVPGIRRANAMGLCVAASDGDPRAPGFAHADYRSVTSTYDVAATVEAARRFHKHTQRLDGVIAMCTDVPLTVAAVADELNLPGLLVHIARLGTDKLAMKAYLAAHGVPVPWGTLVESSTELGQMVTHRGTPLIVKPVDSRGARGVIRLVPGVDPDWAWETARAQSPTGRVMVEAWCQGPQISIEMVQCVGIAPADRAACTVGFLDRNYRRLDEFAPYVIEDGADGPTLLDRAQADAVRGAMWQAMKAVLGERLGTVKGDLVVTEDGPQVIELALRLSGGYMSTELVPRGTGIDLVRAAIRIALGEPLTASDLLRGAFGDDHQRGVAIRFQIPPGCTSHPERRGHAIAEGATREEAVARAEAMVARGEVQL